MKIILNECLSNKWLLGFKVLYSLINRQVLIYKLIHDYRGRGAERLPLFPPQNLVGAASNFFGEYYYEYFRKKNAKFRDKRQIFEGFWKQFDFSQIFSKFGSNFEADFGDLCDYHKSLTKNLEILLSPYLKGFQKA